MWVKKRWRTSVNTWVDHQKNAPGWTMPDGKKRVVIESQKREERGHKVTRVTNGVPKFHTVSHKGAEGGGPKIMWKPEYTLLI